MEPRIDYMKVAADGFRAMRGLEDYLHKCGLEERLLHLIKLRASQINGCAYCLDMHWKDLRAIGESEQRMYFSEKELADLTLAVATSNASNRLSIPRRATPGTYQPPARATVAVS